MQNTLLKNYTEFKESLENTTLSNYKETLKSGIEILRISATQYEGLPVLKYIFETHIDFNDLCYKLDQYLATNVHFNYYRYTRTNKEYKENFDLDLSKHEIRSLLILFRCNYISQGSISRETHDLITTYEYIDRVKDKTSLEALKNQFQNIPAKYIENRYKDKEYKINRAGEYAKMINANLYLLSYNHDLFTQSKKHGRTHNVFTSLNRVYRENELAFQLAEFDIKSANPQIIDTIFGFNRWENVYTNLMQAYEISRNEAKLKYNATLNNYYLTHDQAKQVYLKAGYSAREADQLAKFSAKSNKGDVYRVMAKHEGEIMGKFIDANFQDKPCIQLYDAVYFEPEFYSVENAIEIGVDFGRDLIDKELLNLDLNLNTYKTVLTTPANAKFIVSQIFESKKKLEYKGENFAFYDRNFNQLSARFNINKPIFENDNYRTPTEAEFLERIQKLHKILYYLNESFEPFLECIEHLHNQEGISFNKNYVYAVASKWNFDINDALNYIKNRNWIYYGEALSLSRFNEAYHKERNGFINKIGRRALKKDLKKLYSSLQQNKIYYIDKSHYYYAKRYQAGEIINKVYELIGVKKIDSIERFNKSVHILDTLYKDKYIGCQKTAHLAHKASINRRFADKIKYYYNNKKTILESIYNAIQNIEDLKEPDHIFNNPKEAEPIQDPAQKTLTPSEAFNSVIDYRGGYFDTPLINALEMPKHYFIEWSKHQTIKEIMQGAKGGITQNYDNNKWRKEAIASDIYDNHRFEIMANLRTA